MIYQVKIDQAVLFTGDALDVIAYIKAHTRYRLEWLRVYGYTLGEQGAALPYEESARSFIQ